MHSISLGKHIASTGNLRGASYDITINNPNGVNKGVKKILVDGQEISGNIVSTQEQGGHFKVEVELG